MLDIFNGLPNQMPKFNNIPLVVMYYHTLFHHTRKHGQGVWALNRGGIEIVLAQRSVISPLQIHFHCSIFVCIPPCVAVNLLNYLVTSAVTRFETRWTGKSENLLRTCDQYVPICLVSQCMVTSALGWSHLHNRRIRMSSVSLARENFVP